MNNIKLRIKALILVFVLAITACSNNSISIPTLKFGGLRGNVSMTKESKFDAVEKFGEFFPDDKKVNWLTQYAWEDGEVVGITKREISYR